MKPNQLTADVLLPEGVEPALPFVAGAGVMCLTKTVKAEKMSIAAAHDLQVVLGTTDDPSALRRRSVGRTEMKAG